MESSSETYERVPEIQGLTCSSIVLNSKLEINNYPINFHKTNMRYTITLKNNEKAIRRIA